jgi:hypothetical protein
MRKRSPIRFCLGAVVLLLIALLVVSTTTGALWHHHVNSHEAACPICHMSHTPVTPPLVASSTPDLAQLGWQPELQQLGVAPAPSVRCVPARAPPAA